MVNAISVPLACVKSVDTLAWASNGVNIIGHFIFLIRKQKFEAFPTVSAASKPLVLRETLVATGVFHLYMHSSH
jgi:hypothetical protein